jgi:ACS family tartrate transporter-like MFS transporter
VPRFDHGNDRVQLIQHHHGTELHAGVRKKVLDRRSHWLHTSAMKTGLTLAGIACFAIVAMLLNGAYSDRTGKPCLHAGAGAVLVAIGCLGAALLPNTPMRVAALALVEIGMRSYVPPFLCLTPALLRGTAAAAGIALVNTAFSVGEFFGPSLIGWFNDSTGSTEGAFLVLAAVSVAAAALCMAIRRHPGFALAQSG